MRATYTRLFADEKGLSHFENVTIELHPGFAVPPAAPLNFAPFMHLGRSNFIGAPTGWRGEEPHPVPRRILTIVLSGSIEITAGDGTARKFSAGDIIVGEDTRGTAHSTRVTEEGLSLFIDISDDPNAAP